MKKILLLTAGVIICSIGFAQKGSVLVGGNIEFRKDNNQFSTLTSITDGKNHSTDISPYLGYQFGEKLTVGATASISSARQESIMLHSNSGTEVITVETVSKNKSLAIGPFFRYTEKLSDIFSVFGQLEGLYLNGKRNTATQAKYPGASSQQSDIELSATGVQLRLFPAVFVNIKKNFGLNVSIGGIEYQKYGQKDSDKKPSSFGFSFGKTASIGISKNF